MTTDRSTSGTHDTDTRLTRQRLLIGLAIVAAALLAGALHLVGVLPPG